MDEAITEFVKDACKAGETRESIEDALRDAGWDDEQIKEALAKFHYKKFPVAIPKPKAYSSPRIVALNVFYFLVLYMSVYSVIAILFTFLDYYLPDGLGRWRGSFYGYDPIGEQIRGYLATVICCIPLVYFSNRIVLKAIEQSRQGIPRVRLKLIYFTMFVGACVMLGNAICFIYYFLSGELGMRFIIKVCILSTLIAGLFAYYRAEIRESEEKV